MQKIKSEYFLVILILIAAFFIRVYRINDLLGFWYDQGRDALVVWDFIHKGKLFLIGPTTGIEGVFRGPWYYWLITPFYWLGKGDPVYPSVFLSFTSVVAIGISYFVTRKIGGKVSAMILIVVASFSHYFVSSSRWLSNPTPMFLISMVYVASLLLINRGKKWALLVSVFSIGMAIQFGSAAEIFYVPSLIVVLYKNRKKLPSLKYFIVSGFLLAISFVPQILFDIKHDGVIRNAIKRFILEEKSFYFSFWEVLQTRIVFYYDLAISKLWIENKIFALPFLTVISITGLYKRKLLVKNNDFVTLLVVLASPLFGMLFFQGNNGNVYDYYFTGYYLVIIMIFSVLMGETCKTMIGKIVVVVFFVIFWITNIVTLSSQLFIKMDSKKAIVLGNEIKAVDWILSDVEDKRFNVDVYVPPVIPYAYNYLLLWRSSIFDKTQNEDMTSLIYTIYEEDDYLPSRLYSWQERQSKIGKIIDSKTYGGITVQKRERYE